MSAFRVNVVARNPKDESRETPPVEALVDTGSELTWMPRELLLQIGVSPRKRLTFHTATNQPVMRDVGYAILAAEGFEANDEVVLAEPGDMVLLGARTIEGFAVTVDNIGHRLVARAMIVAVAASWPVLLPSEGETEGTWPCVKAMGSAKVRAGTAEGGHFGPGLFRFLKELRANNNREWFQAQKDRYESEVKEPMLRFIAAFGVRLRTISRNFDADPRPMGGSMFRIYRDTRFSKDKSPYKTAAAAHFQYRRGGKDVHAPGFYLHLEPGDCMGGGGLWHPDATALQKVRERIVTRTKEWKAIVDRGPAIDGDSLKRPPAGYDPTHPFIEDLKRKDIYTMTRFSDAEVCAPDFLERYTEACRSAGPLVEFLTKSLGLAW